MKKAKNLMTKLSYAFKRDLQNLIQRHRIDDLCGKPSYTVTEYIMKQIETYQREHVQPKNWWNDINSNTPSPVYEKGYPSYEAVNSENPVQERYYEYMGRMLKEEKDE